MLDEHRTSDGDGQAEAGGDEDRVLSPTTNARHRGDLTGSESRRRDDRAQQSEPDELGGQPRSTEFLRLARQACSSSRASGQ